MNVIKSYDGVIWFVGKILKYAEINFYNSKSLQDFPLILQIPLDWELKLEEKDVVIRKLQSRTVVWARLSLAVRLHIINIEIFSSQGHSILH